MAQTGYHLSSIYFVNERTGWTVGKDGVILRTNDGGGRWRRQSSRTSLYLRDVLFLDEKEGWAVGDKGVILHTTDGGESWERENSGVDVTLWSMAFTGSGVAAVGEWNTILLYRDERLREYARRFALKADEKLPTRWGAVKWRALYQNFPNPFNMETWIPCVLRGGERLEIYDLNGKLIRRINPSGMSPGYHLIRWDGRNDLGEEVSSGVYFIRLVREGFSETISETIRVSVVR